jgi:hypothetical protein
VCETCGVTEAQYRRARWLLNQHSWATLYRNVSEIDPALMGIETLTDGQIDFVNRSLKSYMSAHPYQGSAAMSADEMRAWFDRREIEREAEIAAATRAGC